MNKTAWDNLSIHDKSRYIKLALDSGVSDLKQVRDSYNLYAKGGIIAHRHAGDQPTDTSNLNTETDQTTQRPTYWVGPFSSGVFGPQASQYTIQQSNPYFAIPTKEQVAKAEEVAKEIDNPGYFDSKYKGEQVVLGKPLPVVEQNPGLTPFFESDFGYNTASFIPVVGDVMSLGEAAEEAAEGNYLTAAAMAGLTLLPGSGLFKKTANKAKAGVRHFERNLKYTLHPELVQEPFRLRGERLKAAAKKALDRSDDLTEEMLTIGREMQDRRERYRTILQHAGTWRSPDYKYTAKDYYNAVPNFFKMNKKDVEKILDTRLYITPKHLADNGVQLQRGADGMWYLSAVADNPLVSSISPKYSIYDYVTGRNLMGEIQFPNSQISLSMPLNTSTIQQKTISNPNSLVGDVQIPDEYLKTLQGNIDYITKYFNGDFKPFGSSVGVTGARFPHGTHDIDGYMTETAWDKWRKEHPNVSFLQTSADTYNVSPFGDNFGKAGKIDINVLRSDSRGMATGERANEMYRQLYPEKYSEKVTESLLTGNPIQLDVTPQQLLSDYNPTTKTIMDSFEIDFDLNNKSKHAGRPFVYMSYAEPAKVSEAVSKFGKELGADDLFPCDESMLLNVEDNKKILEKIGVPVDIDAVAKDPQKMKNVLDYWYLDQTVHMRGVHGSDINTVNSAMREWQPGANAAGQGLNTVMLGNSNELGHGGYGPFVGYFQIKPKNLGEGHTLLEKIQNIERAAGSPNYNFSREEISQIQELARKAGYPDNIVNALGSVTNSESILDILPKGNNYGKEAIQFLQSMWDDMGVASLTRNMQFGSGRYSSMTANLAPNHKIVYQKVGDTRIHDIPSHIDSMPIASRNGALEDIAASGYRLTTRQRNYEPFNRADYLNRSIVGTTGISFDNLAKRLENKLNKLNFQDDQRLTQLRKQRDASYMESGNLEFLSDRNTARGDSYQNVFDKANRKLYDAAMYGIAAGGIAGVGSLGYLFTQTPAWDFLTTRQSGKTDNVEENKEKTNEKDNKKDNGGYLQNLTTKPFSYQPIPAVRYDWGGIMQAVKNAYNNAYNFVQQLPRRASNKITQIYNTITGNHVGELSSADIGKGTGTDIVDLGSNVIRVTPNTTQTGILFNDFVPSDSEQEAGLYNIHTAGDIKNNLNNLEVGTYGGTVPILNFNLFAGIENGHYKVDSLQNFNDTTSVYPIRNVKTGMPRIIGIYGNTKMPENPYTASYIISNIENFNRYAKEAEESKKWRNALLDNWELVQETTGKGVKEYYDSHARKVLGRPLSYREKTLLDDLNKYFNYGIVDDYKIEQIMKDYFSPAPPISNMYSLSSMAEQDLPHIIEESGMPFYNYDNAWHIIDGDTVPKRYAELEYNDWGPTLFPDEFYHNDNYNYLKGYMEKANDYWFYANLMDDIYHDAYPYSTQDQDEIVNWAIKHPITNRFNLLSLFSDRRKNWEKEQKANGKNTTIMVTTDTGETIPVSDYGAAIKDKKAVFANPNGGLFVANFNNVSQGQLDSVINPYLKNNPSWLAMPDMGAFSLYGLQNAVDPDIQRAYNYLHYDSNSPMTYNNYWNQFTEKESNVPYDPKVHFAVGTTVARDKKSLGGHLFDDGGGFMTWLKGLLGISSDTTTNANDTTGKIDWGEIAQRQAYAESKYASDKTSRVGARGIYQIMLPVMEDYNNAMGTNIDAIQLYNDTINTDLRNWYMQNLMNRTWINKDNSTDSVKVGKALAAYNYGPGNTLKALNKAKGNDVDIYNGWEWLNSFPQETQDYVNFILRNQNNSLTRNDFIYNIIKAANKGKSELISSKTKK